MPARYLVPIGSGLLTGSAVVNPATEVVTSASVAAVASTATAYGVIDKVGSSAAVFASTATAIATLEAVGASAAIFASTATYSVTVDVTAGSVGYASSYASYEGESRDAWATNLENKAIGNYTEFSFNSFATVGKRTFGFSDDGVFEITGTTDAGAPIPFFLMSESHSKLGGDDGVGMVLPYAAYLVGNLPESPSVVNVFMATDNDDVYTYPVGETDSRMSTARVLLGKGLRSRYLRYGVVGSAVDSLELASITIKANSSRRNV